MENENIMVENTEVMETEREGLSKETVMMIGGIAVAGAVTYELGKVTVKKVIVPIGKKTVGFVKNLFSKKETELPQEQSESIVDHENFNEVDEEVDE